MKRLCPNCGYFGAMETHIVSGRIELRCPKCGFRVLVIWRGMERKEPERVSWSYVWKDSIKGD